MYMYKTKVMKVDSLSFPFMEEWVEGQSRPNTSSIKIVSVENVEHFQNIQCTSFCTVNIPQCQCQIKTISSFHKCSFTVIYIIQV